MIGIVGCGAWATALGIVSAKHNADKVLMWGRDSDVVASINARHFNPKYLSEIRIPDNLLASDDMAALMYCKVILLVVPVSALKEILMHLLEKGLPSTIPIVVCSKGIDVDALMFPAQMVSDVLQRNPIAFLSGPNFANEVAEGQPASASIAANDIVSFDFFSGVIGSQLALHQTDDLIGAQVCAATKNIIAIASGILDFMGYGHNARASLICAGLNAMSSLVASLGGRETTIKEPCGIADLVLTCSSRQSRNYSFGVALAAGRADLDSRGVIEGKNALKALQKLLAAKKVLAPFFECMYSVVYEGKDPASVLSVAL